MEQVVFLQPSDRVLLNPDRFTQLDRQLGERAARDVLCRTMEELAVRLEHISHLMDKGDLVASRKCTRSLLAIADQIGMDTLTMVADDVLCCIDEGNHVALAATHARMLRIGQRSLSEIWEIQGLSG